MKVLIDTNFFLIPGKFGVDFIKELERFGKPELYTLDLVLRELRMLAEGKGKDARNAKLGIKLIQQKNVRILETRGNHTDEEMERLAAEGGFIVCTQDRELQRRLRNEDIEVIFLRQGKVLAKI
jgi:rRNA-processing protein FCF1